MTNHPAFGRSQSRTNGEFPLPGCALGQEQVGDVGASNEQHQTHHGKQSFERRAGVPLDDGAALCAGVEHDLLIQERFAVFSVEMVAAARQMLHLLFKEGVVIHIDGRLRLILGNSRLQTSQHSQKGVVPVVQSAADGRHLTLHGHGHENIRRLAYLDARESGLGHANDGHRRVVHKDRLIQHARVAAKVLRPVAVAQH